MSPKLLIVSLNDKKTLPMSNYTKKKKKHNLLRWKPFQNIIYFCHLYLFV